MEETTGPELDILNCCICMQMMTDPFVTPCGHSFCYGCLQTHLKNRNSCPSCSRYITVNDIYPNFVLQEVANRASEFRQLNARGPMHVLRRALSQSQADLTLEEVQELISLLSAQRTQLERESSRATLGLLLRLLTHARDTRSAKVAELKALSDALSGDFNQIQQKREDIRRLKDKHREHLEEYRQLSDRIAGASNGGAAGAATPRSLGAGPGPYSPSGAAAQGQPQGGLFGSKGSLRPLSRLSVGGAGIAASPQEPPPPSMLGQSPGGLTFARAGGPPAGRKGYGGAVGSAPAVTSEEAAAEARVKDKVSRVDGILGELRDLYVTVRLGATSGQDLARGIAAPPNPGEEGGSGGSLRSRPPMDGGEEGFGAFADTVTSYLRFGKLRCVAETKPANPNGTCIISSIDFNASEELFAAAAVSKRLSIYRHPQWAEDPSEGPEGRRWRNSNGDAEAGPLSSELLAEYTTKAKLSSVSWSRSEPGLLGCSDYEGQVSLYDVATGQVAAEYAAHDQRVWCLEFCKADPQYFATGSDDGRVHVWSVHASGPRARSAATLDLRINVCSVSWNPHSEHVIAVGTVDPTVLVYDLRRAAEPLVALPGHRRAVSYVRWRGAHQLVSASTDSTVRLWSTLPGATNSMSGGGPTNSFSFSAGGSAGAGGQSLRCMRVFSDQANEKNFVGLSVSGDYIACGSERNEVHAYYHGISKTAARHSFATPFPATAGPSVHRPPSGQGEVPAAPAGPSSRPGAATAAAEGPNGAAADQEGRGRGAAAAGPAAGGARGAQPGKPGGGTNGGPAVAPARFITALCWRPSHHTLVAANSSGTIRVLTMAE